MPSLAQIDKRIAILTEKIEGRREHARYWVGSPFATKGGKLTQIRRAADKAISKLTRKRSELYDIRWRILNTKPQGA
jgi:hypothetical protein